MAVSPGSPITEHFATLTDSRIDHTKRHQLLDILTIALCAIISGADECVAMEEYGNAKRVARMEHGGEGRDDQHAGRCPSGHYPNGPLRQTPL